MLIRHSAIYVFAKLIPGLLGMITTMVLTRLLDPTEYGLYGLSLVVMVFGASAGFDWLQISLLRFYESRREDPNVITTVVQMFTATVGLSVIILTLLLCSGLIAAPKRPIYAIGFVLMWSYAWFELVAQMEIARFCPRNYLVMGLTRAACLFVGAVSAAWLTRDPVWTAVGTAFGILAGSLTSRAPEFRFGRSAFDVVLARQIMTFGLPLAASMVMNSIASSGTRAMVEWLGSPEALGYYTAAFSLVQNTLVVVSSGIAAASYQFAVRAVDAGDPDEARKQLLENGTLLLAVLAPAAVGAALTAQGIAVTLVGHRYAEVVAGLTPWMAGAAFFGGIRANFLDHAFQLGHQPYRQLRVLSAAAVISIVLALWLIPLFGPKGAAIAITAALAFSCVHARIEGAGAYPLPLPIGAGAKILVSCCIMVPPILLIGGSTPVRFACQVASGAMIYAASAVLLDVLQLRTLALSYLLPKYRRVTGKSPSEQGR